MRRLALNQINSHRETPTKFARIALKLTNTKADVIFAFFGGPESMAGDAGLAEFKKNVGDFIDHVQSKQYNGKSAPRVVLFSPIAHEYIQDPNLPTAEQVKARNVAIKKYADAMGEVAKAKKVHYVDIVSATAGERPVGKSLTINGVHQNEQGDLAIAQACEKGLSGTSSSTKSLEALRTAVKRQELLLFNRYRVTDGYSTYGDRAFLSSRRSRRLRRRSFELLSRTA